MRIALVSPFPPSKSGIADYSDALGAALAPRCSLHRVASEQDCARIPQADLAIYQVGNNDAHDFVYASALRHPGVVVLHDANLHYLIADITIKRGNWDAYIAEVAFDGGPDALAYAQAVRRLEVGPDYLGVPMLRRVLQHARGLVVHSEFVAAIARDYGYRGPLAVIPHGAWIPDVQGAPWRAKLGVPEATPLIGVFGHLKPYKRITETLRAFRRIVRRNPFARLLLVGEEHPDLPLAPLLDGLDLRGYVQHVDFAPIEEFVGYLAACDIVVNLRYPTVGESSGSMLRALGLGKPVLVSEVGAFAEFPDEVCLKIPVGAPLEEELLYEYLLYLCERPDDARILGGNARRWVEETCNWDRVAGLYLDFCRQVLEAREPAAASGYAAVTEVFGQPAEVLPPPAAPDLAVPVDAGQRAEDPGETGAASGEAPGQEAGECDAPIGDKDILPAPAPDAQGHVDASLPEREVLQPAHSPLPEDAAVLPAGEAELPPAEAGDTASEHAAPGLEDASPEVAASAVPQWETPLARALLAWAPDSAARGYLMQHLSRLMTTIELLPPGDDTRSVLEMGCYMQITPLLQEWKRYGEVRGSYYGTLGEQRVQTATAPDGSSFSCVVDSFDAERDPFPYPDERFDMVICTELFEHLGHDPLHCLAEIHRILKPGGHLLLSTPNVCSSRAIAAILTGYHPGFFPAFMRPSGDGPVDPRHHREYAPREIRQALIDCGFAVETLVTGPYWSEPTPQFAWVEHLLERYELDQTERGECIFALARKAGPVVDRYPAWLYYG